MKVHVIGGFLGAGKTTAIRALARILRERGERVAVVTNDQGEALVDTALCQRDALEVTEIPGGCFCCRYPDLEQALLEAEWTGATVALAEAVGSCTDLLATVLSPLVARRGSRLEIAPLSVLVDPLRLEQMMGGAFSEHVRYLFEKQIEEADVLVLTRADIDSPDVAARLRSLRPGAAVVRVSAVTGLGMAEWLEAAPIEAARPLEVDYDRYAEAEAELGWANGRVSVRATDPFAVSEVLSRFLDAVGNAPVAHVKLAALDGTGGSANLVCKGGAKVIEASGHCPTVSEVTLLVNARAALSPEALEGLLKSAMDLAAGDRDVVWHALSCFRPGRPVPTHRHVDRCFAQGDACCPAPRLPAAPLSPSPA